MVGEIPRRLYESFKPMLPRSVDETLRMWRCLGYLPNVYRPRTFNEKIAHRKLFTNDLRFTKLSDKWGVREFVRQRIGEQYLIHVYDCVRDVSEIDLHSLPDSFVIKCTHDSGSTVIVRDKDTTDWGTVLRELRTRLNTKYGVRTNEYWYDRILPAVLLEEKLNDDVYDVPLDFKFFVFHGTVQVVQVIHRAGRARQRFFTRTWHPLSVRRPSVEEFGIIPEPRQLRHMIEIAEVLGADFDFVRVDLYAPNDEYVKFGEMTFAPAAGRKRFIPHTFDWELGSYW